MSSPEPAPLPALHRAALETIARADGVSRDQLSDQLAVSRSTATRVIHSLTEAAVVEQRAETAPRHKAGRPRRLVHLAGNA